MCLHCGQRLHSMKETATEAYDHSIVGICYCFYGGDDVFKSFNDTPSTFYLNWHLLGVSHRHTQQAVLLPLNSSHKHFLYLFLYILICFSKKKKWICVRVVLNLQQPLKFCPMYYIFKLYIIWMSLCLEKIKYFVSLKGSCSSSPLLLSVAVWAHSHSWSLAAASSSSSFTLIGNCGTEQIICLMTTTTLVAVVDNDRVAHLSCFICGGMELHGHIQRNMRSIHIKAEWALQVFTSDLDQAKCW